MKVVYFSKNFGLVRVENTDQILAILKGLGYNNSVKFTR